MSLCGSDVKCRSTSPISPQGHSSLNHLADQRTVSGHERDSQRHIFTGGAGNRNVKLRSVRSDAQDALSADGDKFGCFTEQRPIGPAASRHHDRRQRM